MDGGGRGGMCMSQQTKRPPGCWFSRGCGALPLLLQSGVTGRCVLHIPAVSTNQLCRRHAGGLSQTAGARLLCARSWLAGLPTCLPACLPCCPFACLPAACLPGPQAPLSNPQPQHLPPLCWPQLNMPAPPHSSPSTPPPRARLPSSSACHILTALSEEHVTNRSL